MDTAQSKRSVASLLPIMRVVFIAFLIIGPAMPVLPQHVHQGLGLSTFVVVLCAAAIPMRLLPPSIRRAGGIHGFAP